MAGRATARSPLVHARVAALLYLVMLVAGSFAGSVHTRLVVPGDAATTARNVAASESLFRLGAVGVLVMNAVFMILVWVLYKLLRPVNEGHALLMVALALAGATIGMLNQFTQGTVLLLLSGAPYLNVFSAEQLQALVMLFLDLQKQIGTIASIFYGLWLFPLGYLVFRSGFFPRALGVLLMIGCFGYLLLFVQRFLLPSYEAIGYARFAAHGAELSWLLWLLIKGVDVERWEARALESARGVPMPQG